LLCKRQTEDCDLAWLEDRVGSVINHYSGAVRANANDNVASWRKFKRLS
jgi:hypothetical protein